MDKNFNSKEIEARWSKYWEDEDLFTPSGTGEPYSIVIPPPNVTGTLHMGHAFLNTIIDTLIRYQRMNGKNVLWQMGTDHAGIATQMVVERRLAAQGKNKRDMGREKFLAEVWKWKEMSSGTIEKQLRRLGASVDWKTSRFTMDDAYINSVIEAFVRLHEKGLVYRSKRLVNWDPVLQTAVSDLEVRAVEEPSTLYYIRYPFVNDPTNKSCMVISTTRPETTLADGAVAVHPDDERYKAAVGRMVRVPGTDRIIPVIADEYVKPDFGSGCVKITPAHDFNDYEVGQRHTMETINLFTKDAHLNENAPPAYRGMDRYEARTKIVQDFKQQGLLAKEEKHSYSPPRGDRSGVILEPYLTDQWYINMDTMAQRAIKAVKDKKEVKNKKTKFVSPMWEKSYYTWLNEIQDWCVSRQLWWGHRIPAWYDEDGKPYVGRNQEEARTKNNLDSSVKLRQDEDVLDTWFSSALWTFATMGWPKKSDRQKTFNPTDLLVTGFDIIFFWVARMIMVTLCLKDQVPFHNVYIHGLVRDAEGQKMSKSKGNILDPLDIIDGVELEELLRKRTTDMMQPDKAKSIAAATKKHFPDGIAEHGTDALRFTFCAMASTGSDLNFDTSRCIGYRNLCNKLWNAARYVLMQCEGEQPGGQREEIVDAANASESTAGTANFINQWMQWRFDIAAAEISTSLDNYRIDLAAQALYELVWNEFCDWYIEFTKPILASDDEQAKASIKQGLISMLDNILRLAHPFIPFITEEIWQHLHAENKSKSVKSIMVSEFPLRAQKSDVEITESNKKFAAVAWMKEFVQGARIIRSETNIAPNILLEFIMFSNNKNEKKWLEEYADIIKPLTRCNKLSTLTDGTTKPPAIARLAGEGEILMPLTANNQQSINKEEEIERLQKKKEATNEDIIKLKNKLNNKEFTNKAPPHIVDGVKHKLQEQQAARQKIYEQLTEVYYNLDSPKSKLKYHHVLIDYFTQVINTDPNNIDTYNSRGEIKNEIKNVQEVNNTNAYNNLGNVKPELIDYPGTTNDCTQVINTSTNHKKDYNNHDNTKSKTKDYQAAIDDFTQTIKTEPKNAHAYYNRGNAKSEINDYSGAIDDFTQAIKINPKDASAYYNRANANSQLKNYQSAIDDLTQAIKINPKDAGAYYNRASANSQLGNYNEAINDLTKASKIEPNNANAYFNRASANSQLENYNGAIDDLTKAIKIEPNNVGAYYNRASAKSQINDYKGAIDDLTKAINIEPNNAGAYYNRASAKSQINDYKGTIDDLTQAIKIEPNNTGAYYNRASANSQLGNYNGAIDDFTKVIKIEPNNINAYFSRASANSQINDYQSAIDDLTKAINIKPNNVNAYFNRASSNSQLGNYQGAIDDLTQAIKIEPNNAGAYFSRASANNQLENYNSAIDDLTKAIKIEPNNAGAYYNRASTKSQLKDYKGAIDDFTKAIKIEPNNANAYYSRASAKSQLKDYKMAINDSTEVIKINPNDAGAYYIRGVANYELKYYQKAIDDFTKTIKIEPNNANAYNDRGNVKYRLKDYRGAIDNYNKAIEIDPNYANAYYNRASTKNQLTYYQEAIDDFTKAINIEPNNANTYYNRADTKSQLQDYKGAIDDLTQAIKIDPNNANTYYNRGHTKHDLEDYRGAIDDFTQAIEIDPTDANAYYNRGHAKYELKDYLGAINDSTTVIKIDPNNKNAYYMCGHAKYELKDYKGAIDDFTQAINIDSNNENAYYNRGNTKNKLQDYKGAINDFAKAIKIEPNGVKFYTASGTAKSGLGLDKCESKDYKDADAYFEGAMNDYQTAIKLSKDKDVIDNTTKVLKSIQKISKEVQSTLRKNKRWL